MLEYGPQWWERPCGLSQRNAENPRTHQVAIPPPPRFSCSIVSPAASFRCIEKRFSCSIVVTCSLLQDLGECHAGATYLKTTPCRCAPLRLGCRVLPLRRRRTCCKRQPRPTASPLTPPRAPPQSLLSCTLNQPFPPLPRQPELRCKPCCKLTRLSCAAASLSCAAASPAGLSCALQGSPQSPRRNYRRRSTPRASARSSSSASLPPRSSRTSPSPAWRASWRRPSTPPRARRSGCRCSWPPSSLQPASSSNHGSKRSCRTGPAMIRPSGHHRAPKGSVPSPPR